MTYIERRNSSNIYDMHTHFRNCPVEFLRDLEARVPLREYILKIKSNAENFEIWDRHDLIGLLSVYCNDEQNRSAFITNVSVVTKFQKMGLGAKLIERCMEYVSSRNFNLLELEVAETNTVALKIYSRKEFEILDKSGRYIRMFYNFGRLK